MGTTRFYLLGLFLAGWVSTGQASQADLLDTLHDEINQAIAHAHSGPQAAICGDHEFVRRVYLDLVGRIPSIAEIESFFSRSPATRRAELVDELLSSDACNAHLAVVFDLMWMERRQDQHVTTAEWREYLEQAFAADQPLNELISEIIAATGERRGTGGRRAAAKFLLDRDVETHALTRDLSRMFFGRDIQCAQCHDHPLIADYSQAEYHGLLAFVNRSYRQEVDDPEQTTQKVSLVAERSEGEASFSSVFEPGADPELTLPVLPSGIAFDHERLLNHPARPALTDGRNEAAPDSRRAQLAEIMREGRSLAMRRNLANRLWRIVMKRGLVEPPDLIHPDNPAVYPLLLDRLADALAESKFDTKAILRAIVLSDAYQRSVEIPEALPTELETIIATRDALLPEQQFQRQVLDRARERTRRANRQLRDGRQRLIEIRQQMQAILDQQKAALKQRDEAVTKRDSAQQIVAQAEALVKAAAEAQTAAAGQPGDKPLAEAANLLKQRAEAAQGSLPAARENAQKQQAIVEAQHQAIQQADQQLAPLAAAREAQTIAVKELSGAHQAFFEIMTLERSRGVHLDHQIELLNQLEAIANAVSELAALQQQRPAQVENHATLLARSQQLTTEHARQQRLLESLESRYREANQQWQALTDADNKQSALIQELTAAKQQVSAAAAQLGGDPPLAQTAHQLEDRIANLQQQRDEQAAALLASEAARRQTARRVADQVAIVKQHEQRLSAAQQAEREADEQLAASESALAAKSTEVKQAKTDLRVQLARRFVVGQVQGLSAEQLAASLFQAFELEPRFRAEAAAEWEAEQAKKLAEDTGEAQAADATAGEDPAGQAATAKSPGADMDDDDEQRLAEIEARYQKKRQQIEASIVPLFSATPGNPQDTFQATVDQALFMANDGRLQNWLRPSRGNLAERLGQLSDDEQLATQLYLAVLTRLPTDREVELVGDYLHVAENERRAAIQEMIWSLVTSVEFRFNH